MPNFSDDEGRTYTPEAERIAQGMGDATPACPGPSEPHMQVAERIARSLFTNGQGQRAQRLVLTVDGPPLRDLGGWCERAVVDRIAEALAQSAAASRVEPPASPSLTEREIQEVLSHYADGAYRDRIEAALTARGANHV